MAGLPFQRLPASQMLAQQEEQEQNEVTRWFDTMRYGLDQQELEPEQHQKQYAQIMRQAQQRGLAIKSRHEANAQFLRHIDELVEGGHLQEFQGKKIAYRMAGIADQEMLKELSGEPKQINWTRAYNENVGVQRNIVGFLKNYKVDRSRLFEVYATGPNKGEIINKKRPEEADVVQHFNMALNLLDYYKEQERHIYGQLTPMGQAALEMERVATQGLREQPSLASRLFRYGLKGTAIPARIGMKASEMLGDKTPKDVLLGPDLPRPTTEAEYNRLMLGTKYIHPDKGIQTKR